jgi:hypothetical protein
MGIYVDSVSMVTSSKGSKNFLGFLGSYLRITYGGVTANSKPSLLIFSISTPKCRSPLPEISILSEPRVAELTLNDTSS